MSTSRGDAMSARGERLHCRSVSMVPEGKLSVVFSFFRIDFRRLASCCSCSKTWRAFCTHANVRERILLSVPLQSSENGWWAQNPDSACGICHLLPQPSLASPLFGTHSGCGVNSGKGWFLMLGLLCLFLTRGHLQFHSVFSPFIFGVSLASFLTLIKWSTSFLC